MPISYNIDIPTLILGGVIILAIVFAAGYWFSSSGSQSGTSFADWWSAFWGGIFPPSGV